MDESLEHFFMSCICSKDFCTEVIKWIENLEVKFEHFSDKDINVFMLFEVRGQVICQPHIISCNNNIYIHVDKTNLYLQ